MKDVFLFSLKKEQSFCWNNIQCHKGFSLLFGYDCRVHGYDRAMSEMLTISILSIVTFCLITKKVLNYHLSLHCDGIIVFT